MFADSVVATTIIIWQWLLFCITTQYQIKNILPQPVWCAFNFKSIGLRIQQAIVLFRYSKPMQYCLYYKMDGSTLKGFCFVSTQRVFNAVSKCLSG